MHDSVRRLHTGLACALFAAGLLLADGAAARQASKPSTPAPASSTVAPAPASAANGSQPASAEQLFADWDKDKNKQLSLEEFRNGWEEARQMNMIGRLEVQFRGADTNHSGQLEAAEYSSLPIIKRAGGGAPPISAFDTNANNSLDFKEYVIMVQAMIKRGEAR